MEQITHRISIPVMLKVGRNKLDELGALVCKSKLCNVVIFLGSGIWKLFGSQIEKSMNSLGQTRILKVYNFDDNEISEIVKIAFSIPAQTGVLVGVGGGRVLDVAKYVAFLNNLPYISVPTSMSNDGFSSSICSLLINGRRTSVYAKMPTGIVVDIDVIKTSPDRFTYSGIGDLISKITALRDWEFEEQNHRTRMDDFSVMIAKKSVNSILRMNFINIIDEAFLYELVDSLTMSGISMEIAGNSAPASGSEHLISHAMDKLSPVNQLHGTQVGVAAYIMSKVQNNRFDDVKDFLTRTGFFEHVKTLKMRADDFKRAIDAAPSIKPNRYTYIHLEAYRLVAKNVVDSDEILRQILV